MPKKNLNRSLDSVKEYIIKLILIFLLKREEHMYLDSCSRANSTNRSQRSKSFQEQKQRKNSTKTVSVTPKEEKKKNKTPKFQEHNKTHLTIQNGIEDP